MPQISKQKKDKIAEQILSYLFSVSPESRFTSDIAKEIARDEEFVKVLLHDLTDKKLLNKVTKSPEGIDYERRQRWRLSDKAYTVYKQQSL